MTLPATAVRRAPRGAPLTLVEIGERLKRDARARPNKLVEPAQPLSNKAQLAMIYFQADGWWFLRIARKGLSPLNDFAPQTDTYLGGVARLKRWRSELKTFRRDLGVPEHATSADGAEGLLYYVDLWWREENKP